MLTIKDKEFEMVQVKGTPFFNLSILTPINLGKENERMEMKLLGYGLPFETCLQTMVSIKLSHKEDTCTVLEYISLYKATVEEISKLISEEETQPIEPGLTDTEHENTHDC
jgi:hypothetical protein